MSREEIDKMLNDKRMATPLYRYRTRKLLIDKYGKTEDEALEMVPKTKGNRYIQGVTKVASEQLDKDKDKPRTRGNRFKTGIIQSAKDTALDIAKTQGIDAAIDYISETAGTDNSAMNQISTLKKTLQSEGIDVTDIDNSALRKEIQARANEKIDQRREEKLYEDNFTIHPNFSYNNVINRLAIYGEQDIIEPSMQFIADMLIAFSARPGELYKLKFIGDKITGHLKTRGDNTPVKYAGIYPIPMAKKMLLQLPKELDLTENKNVNKLSQFMQKYKMQPRSLRTIGAEYTTLSYKPSERRKIRQLALRHKKMSTSLASYQMPVNIN